MKGVISMIGLGLLLVACTQKKKAPVSVYDPQNFIRVTPDADSIKEMRVAYLSRGDGKRTMMRLYFNDGSLMGVGYFYNLKKDGRWTQYSEGKLSFEGSFQNGEKTGTHTYYFSNGKPMIIETYKAGKMTGKTEYAEDGTLLYNDKMGNK